MVTIKLFNFGSEGSFFPIFYEKKSCRGPGAEQGEKQ